MTPAYSPIQSRISKIFSPNPVGFEARDLMSANKVKRNANPVKPRRILIACFFHKATRNSRSMIGGMVTRSDGWLSLVNSLCDRPKNYAIPHTDSR